MPTTAYDVVEYVGEDLTGVTRESEFPKELSDYIAWIEENLNVPVSIVSVGPDRKQTILRGRK